MKNSELIKMIICDVIAVTDMDSIEENFKKLIWLVSEYNSALWAEKRGEE